MQRLSSFAAVAAGMFGFALVSSPSADAAVLYDSAGFESPTYTAGDLAGQDGWGGQAEYDVVNNAANAHVGSQYVEAVAGGGSATVVKDFTTSTGNLVTMNAWMRISSGTSHWIDLQLRESDNSSFAALGFQNIENGFSNDIVYRDAVPGDGGSNAYIALAKYTPDTWFEIRAELDMVANNWDLYLNNVQIGNNLPRRVSSADSIGRISIDREPTSGNFRIDDLIVGDPIPEPSIGLVGLALIGLFGRRQRKA